MDEDPAGAAPQAAVADPGLARPAPALALRRAAPALDAGSLPASDVALSARLNERLAALQVAPAAVGIPAPALPSGGGGAPARLAAGPGPGGGAPIALRHGGGDGPPALALTRAPGGAGAAPAVVAAGLPARASAAPATAGDASARRTLAGASLMGPVADRAILSRSTPVYPEWAKSEAVEASVTLYFVVRPDGTVKENVLVQKTAGFEDFDESARTALRDWRFEPLRDGHTGEQWGTITFHFRLRDAG
jgi:TonB family protein